MDTGHPELRGFRGDRPVITLLGVCDSFSAQLGGGGRPSLLSLIDVIFATQSPVMIAGTVVAAIAGIREPVDCRFESVAYTAAQPLGVTHVIGNAHVEPPQVDVTMYAYVTGTIAFAVESIPSKGELRIYCNGERLQSKPILIMPPPTVGPTE